MKRFYSLKLFSLLLFATGSIAVSEAATYFTYNGIRYVYNADKTQASVAPLKTPSVYTGDIVIPEVAINSAGQEIPVVAVTGTAFTENAMITSVTLPESVVEIADYAFDSCEGLIKVVMPGVKKIGNWSFRNCYALEELKFSDKLESIGNYAFDKILKITEIDLPASTTALGGYVFEGNPQIKKVICRATTPPSIKKGYLNGEEIYTLFEDTDYGDMELYVPEESIPLYKSLLGWCYFNTRIYPIQSGVEEVVASGNKVDVRAIGNGSVEISLPYAAEVAVYNIVGQAVKSALLPDGKSVISGIAPGFYIICGNKIAVK